MIRGSRKKLWFAIMVNAAFLLFLLLVTRPYYITNDDFTLATFFNRGRAQDGWTDISSYLFGVIVSACFKVTAQLPWYTMFLYGATFFSLTAVTYLLMKHFEGWPAMALSGILLVYFGYECYVTINFTKIAGCAAAAGAFVIYFSVREQKNKPAGAVIGALMILMGYVIRPEEALASAVSTAAGGVYLLLRIRKDVPQGERGKRFLRYVLPVALAGVLVLGAKAFDTYALRSSEERQAYQRYMVARTSIMDYEFPSYDKNKEAYEKLGINRNAWNLYRGWNFYDTEKFGVETMEEVEKLQTPKKLSMDTVRDFLKKYPDMFFENQIFLVYLFILVLVVLYGKHNKESLISILLHLALMFVLFFYLFYEGRYGIRRADVGIWWGGILGLLVILDQKRLRMEPKTAIALALFALIISQADWKPNYRRQTKHNREAEISNQNYTSILSNDQEHLYICMTGAYFPTSAYGPFDRVPVGALSNIVTLGGWAAQSVPFVDVYARYGVTNPFRDMIGSDTIRVVTRKTDMLVQYLRDYYDPDCTAEEVDKIGKYSIYAIRK